MRRQMCLYVLFHAKGEMAKQGERETRKNEIKGEGGKSNKGQRIVFAELQKPTHGSTGHNCKFSGMHEKN